MEKPASFFSVPPIRAKIEREWSYFLAGKTYNISCQIQGSNPAAYAKVKIGNRELKLLDDQVKNKSWKSLSYKSLVSQP